jgi:transposase
MLDEHQRIAILQLAKQGLGTRRIARALKVSRAAVRQVMEHGTAEPPRIVRAEKAEPHRELIIELHTRCKGNLVRVYEELLRDGATLSYQALTAFCRRHQIGYAPKLPAGRYDFAPGQEMQHDTSPHRLVLGGRLRETDTASLVLCFSRLLFFQFYPKTFDRLACKFFLTDALQYTGGAAARCMVDNTNVVRLRGTGKHMVPVPEMQCFAERFGFVFVAHEVGDANRSARVEGPFNIIENNFLAGREFRDWDDANEQARAWCDTFNAKYSSKLRSSRRDLFALERSALKPLPDFIPEVYALHQRIVDAEGYVNVRRTRYSVPYRFIGHPVEVRESKQRIDVFDGPRLLATHRRILDVLDGRVTVPEHRPPRGEGQPKSGPPSQEREITVAEPLLAPYAAGLRQRAHGRGVRELQRLLRLLREYPRESLLAAVREAQHYGLYDLDRLERLILRHIARDYFVLPEPEPEPEDEDEDEPEDGEAPTEDDEDPDGHDH